MKLFIKSAVMSVAMVMSAGVFAQTASTWDTTHPRRAEVNSRLANQNRRIHHEVKDGQLTHAQAQNLHREDHAIRQEERTDASFNNTHITKPEQRQINQQENQVSQQIKQQ
jgi:hypothetical protein